ncbi:hypothetical protein COW98_00015 [Candidatus Roizmanbacteria bacterium CG22_combo_CG10-13_8_21_14_all_35_9]|uniref:Chorismate mutase domain-containing protein n=1 Tax=Candidatus Roizmanbacteria bacterium CG22_combo_CG10-13_8_21_14_all_35_9 TaxID=1974861 RepID=A0A2H0BZW2_9BACT|nr:MAG: hypothetical protein COW98_00015 [Candidatus Roizmanbacteria bacterium CG22_combo_CG10-13_8_21_14_all_35_9]
MKNQIDDLRKQIDEIDNLIVNLLAKRLTVVKKVGKWKNKKGLVPLDKSRWQKILTSKIVKAKKLKLNPKLIKNIWNLIHEEALKIEKSL